MSRETKLWMLLAVLTIIAALTGCDYTEECSAARNDVSTWQASLNACQHTPNCVLSTRDLDELELRKEMKARYCKEPLDVH